jgi:hypothetical protein
MFLLANLTWWGPLQRGDLSRGFNRFDRFMAPRKWGFNLKSKSTDYPDHGHHGDPPPMRKIPMVEPGIKPGTSWLVVRSSDHQTTRLVVWVNVFWFLIRVFALLQGMLTGAGSHPAPCWMITGDFFPWVKWQGGKLTTQTQSSSKSSCTLYANRHLDFLLLCVPVCLLLCSVCVREWKYIQNLWQLKDWNYLGDLGRDGKIIM